MPSRAPQFCVSALCERKRNAICKNLVTQSAAGIEMGSRLFSISSTMFLSLDFFNLDFFFLFFFCLDSKPLHMIYT
jgi:hypothetical protein